MVMTRASRSSWLLTTFEPIRVPELFHPALEEWSDVTERARNAGVPEGVPILTRFKEAAGGGLSCHVDGRLQEYYESAFKYPKQRRTALSYAEAHKTWFEFLDAYDDHGIEWDEALPAHVRRFWKWRLFDESNVRERNGETVDGRVAPSTWNRELAALKHFYKWATKERVGDDGEVFSYVAHNPIPDGLSEPDPDSGHRQRASLMEANGRRGRDRYLLIADYRLFRDVGFLGYEAEMADDGTLEPTHVKSDHRAWNEQRNAAFCDFTVTSALRLSEAGGHLKDEILAVEMDGPVATLDGRSPMLPATLAKGGRTRAWTVLNPWGLIGVREYIDGERRRAVRRAQREGRYDDLVDPIVVTEKISAGQGVKLVAKNWRTPKLMSKLTLPERMRLYEQTDAGLEPMMLWLTDSGRPMDPKRWDTILWRASEKVSAERARHGKRNTWVRVNVHTLRSTFALFALVAFVQATDEVAGRTWDEPWRFENYSHCFDRVADLMGHSSVRTTLNDYLEPVKSLRTTAVFVQSDGVNEALNQLAARADGLIGWGE